jgi:hypothetical protein
MIDDLVAFLGKRVAELERELAAEKAAREKAEAALAAFREDVADYLRLKCI